MGKRLLTQEQHDFLARNIPGKTNQELADLLKERFGITVTRQQVKSYKTNHKLGSSGLTGQFQKGYVPVNKGTKGMFNVGGNRTSFKKGQKAHNYRPIGSERITTDNYVMVKVQDEGPCQKRWKLKSRILWEEAYGPIPRNCVLIYRDGNSLNCTLENLLLVSQRELQCMNKLQIKRTSEEVTQAMHTLAKIEIRKSELKKRGKK